MSDQSALLRRKEPVSNDLLDCNASVRLEVRCSLGIAHLSVRKGQQSLLAQRVARQLKVDLPHSQWHTATAGITVLGLTPTNYLAIADGSGPAWVWELGQHLGDCCAVSDQSGAFSVVRVSGPGARAVLGAGLFLDFADDSFSVGRVAAALLSHFNVIVWRLPGDSVFDLAVPRSFARDLCRWLSERGRMANP